MDENDPNAGAGGSGEERPQPPPHGDLSGTPVGGAGSAGGGGGAAPPKSPQEQPRPSIQELHEHFKLPDDLMSGAYANSVLIGHSPSEFLFDFITGFYPTASVSCRVFLSAQQVPRTLETLNAAL